DLAGDTSTPTSHVLRDWTPFVACSRRSPAAGCSARHGHPASAPASDATKGSGTRFVHRLGGSQPDCRPAARGLFRPFIKEPLSWTPWRGVGGCHPSRSVRGPCLTRTASQRPLCRGHSALSWRGTADER